MPQLRATRAAAERRSPTAPTRSVGVARGLVGCSIPGPRGYQRFRSVESKDCCPNFDPEPDTERIERRYETVRILRAAFDQWRKELQSKAKK